MPVLTVSPASAEVFPSASIWESVNYSLTGFGSSVCTEKNEFSETNMRNLPTVSSFLTSVVSPIAVANGSDRKSAAVRPDLTRADIIAAIKNYQPVFVTMWNKWCKKLDAPDFVLDYAKNFDGQAESYADEFASFYKDHGKFGERGHVAFDDTVKAAIEVLITLARGEKHPAIKAPMQSGKTGIIVLVSLVWRLFAKSQNKKTMVSLIPYGRLGPTEETQKDYRATRNILANIRFKKGDPITLAAANSQEKHTDHEKLDSRTTKEKIRAIIKRAVDAGVPECVIILDEADYASGNTGALNELVTIAKSHPTLKVRFVLLSATPYEFQDLKAFELIEIIKDRDSGYQGVVQGRWLNIRGMTDVAKVFGLRELQDDFHIKKNGSRRIASVCKLISALVRGHNAPSLDLNGLPLNGGRCIVVRYGSGVQTSEFLKYFKKHFDHLGLNVIEYFEKGMVDSLTKKPITVEDALKNLPGLSLIVIKGAGRRADRFPAACTVFLDFTHKYTTAESFYQGLIGRACGYKGDNVFVMVSDLNKAVVDQTRDYFKATGLDEPQLKSSRAKRVGEGATRVVRKRTADRYQIVFSKLDVHLAEEIKAAIRTTIVPYLTMSQDSTGTDILKVASSSRRKVVTMSAKAVGGKLWFDYDAALGGRATIMKIERHLSSYLGSTVRLLRAGQVRSDEKYFKTIDGGFIDIAVGRSNRGRTGANDVTSRDGRRVEDKTARTRGRADGDKNVLKADFSFLPMPDGSFEPVGVLVLFADRVEDLSQLNARAAVGRFLPRDICAYHQMGDAAEQLEAA